MNPWTVWRGFAGGAGSESKMRVPVAKGPEDRRQEPRREILGLRCCSKGPGHDILS